MTIETIIEKKIFNTSLSPIFWATNDFLEQFMTSKKPDSFLVQNTILDYVQQLSLYSQQIFYTTLLSVYTDMAQVALDATPQHKLFFSLQKASRAATRTSNNGYSLPANQLDTYIKQLIHEGYAHK